MTAADQPPPHTAELATTLLEASQSLQRLEALGHLMLDAIKDLPPLNEAAHQLHELQAPSTKDTSAGIDASRLLR